MKIRTGFVSNSSSSSFIVIMKNGKEMTKSALLESFEVGESSPLYGFANDLSEWMMKNLVKQDIKSQFDNYCYSSSGKLTEDEMINSIVESCSEKYKEKKREELEKIRNNEFFCYEGSASNDSGDGLEYYLCETGIKVDNKNITIKSGGY